MILPSCAYHRIINQNIQYLTKNSSALFYPILNSWQVSDLNVEGVHPKYKGDKTALRLPNAVLLSTIDFQIQLHPRNRSAQRRGDEIMTDPTWDAVMRRNSNTPVAKSNSPRTQRRIHDCLTSYVELGQQTIRNEFRNHQLLHDPCNDSGWMDFLQILVHQHAKTIVHLQDLTAEVEKLKDFRSSFISSITADLGKSSSAGPPDHLHHLPQTKDVWTSSPNKLIDSGFSTETKESANQKEDEDPLYSLLDLIQTKVSNSTSTNSTHNPTSTPPTCSCISRVNNGTKQSAIQLGKLDLVLGFKSGIGENVMLPRELIRAILRELDTVELQRQLLFAAANIKTLESKLSSLEFEEKNSSRLASKYLALSHENELLRFKLKEQEIQLEGTKAKLRILERNIQSGSTSLKLSLVPLDSLPKATATYASANSSSLVKHLPSHSVSDECTSRHILTNNCYSIPSDSSSDDKKGTDHIHHIQSQSQGHSTNEPITCRHSSTSSSTLLTHHTENKKGPLSSFAASSKSENRCEEIGPIRKNLSDRQIPLTLTLGNQSEKSNENVEKKLGIQRLVPRPVGVSKIPIRPQSSQVQDKKFIVNNSPASPSTQTQSICSKSPGSSISSKSSIPIAVTRLKRNGGIQNVNGGVGNGTATTLGRKPGSNFWTTWFAT